MLYVKVVCRAPTTHQIMSHNPILEREFSRNSIARTQWAREIMDVGGNGSGLPVNNKQRAMLPNKTKGEFTRNPRKDSEVRRQASVVYI